MIEHLLILLIEQAVRRQRAKSQASLAQTMPEFNLLWTRPKEVLADRAVVICPKRILPQGVILSVSIGSIAIALVIFAGHFLFVGIVQPMIPQQPVNAAIFIIAGAAAVLCLCLIAFRTARRSSMGGEMLASVEGLELSIHESAVRLPWALLRLNEPFRGDENAVLLPINPHQVNRVELLRHGGIVECGSSVRTKAFRFVSECEIELRNLYAANLRDVARLLQNLGQKLG